MAGLSLIMFARYCRTQPAVQINSSLPLLMMVYAPEEKLATKKPDAFRLFLILIGSLFFCRIRSLFSSLFLRKWTDDCWKRSLIGLAAFFSLVSLHSFLSHAYTPLYESSFHKLLMTIPHSIEPFGNDRFQFSSQAGDRKQKN